MELNMRRILLIVIFCAFLQNVFGQSQKVASARAKLKKWGIAYCIIQTYPDSKFDSLAAEAKAAYFELGSHTTQAYKFIKAYINQYIKSPKYMGQFDQDLSLMKCLDLIDNKQYNQKIIDCDKWITGN